MAYCLSLVGVYFVSTLSHAVQDLSLRRTLRKWDQGLIYLLIVSTYTPFALLFLQGYWHGITIAMWLFACGGFWSKIAFEHRIEKITVALYVVVGWLPIVTIPQLLSVAPQSVVTLMVAGGLAYSVGVMLLVFDRRLPYLHTAWHVFVLAGSALHYWAISIGLNSANLDSP